MPIGITTTPSAFDVTSYLNQIKGVTPVQQPSPVPETSTDTETNNTDTTKTQNVSTTGTGQVELSSAVLSVLQSFNPSSRSGQLAGNLFDSTGTAGDFLSGLYNTVLYNYTSSRPLTQALENARTQALGNSSNNNPVQNVIQSYNDAQNAASAQARQNVDAAVKLILGGQESIIA